MLGGCFCRENPQLSADMLRQAWVGMPEGRHLLGGFPRGFPPHCLPQPQAPGLITCRAHPEVGDPLGQPRPGGADSSLCAPFTVYFSLMGPAGRFPGPYLYGWSLWYPPMAEVRNPHPHPKSKAGATSLPQDLNLAWWGLGEMVAWCVLLAFSSKFFWVVPGGFHSKWRIISSLEVLAAIPRQQKEFRLTSCSQAHSFIRLSLSNTGR